MLGANECHPWAATPFSFSILVNSPIRCNLPFCPVSAMLFPLARTNLYVSSLIVIGLDILMAFLFKRSLVHPPPQACPPPEGPLLFTLPQLAQLMCAAANGQSAVPPYAYNSPGTGAPGQGHGPVGHDEPLFPDNLSVSLVVSAPFALFDGSPDTSFNVPLFELPGAPGNLIIALGLFIAQFYIERAGVGTPGCQPDGNGNGNGNGNGIPNAYNDSNFSNK